MTHQNKVRFTIDNGEVYIFDSNENTTVNSILVKDVLPHEIDDLKRWMDDEPLGKIWNEASILERILNAVLRPTIEAEGSQELVSLNEIRQQLEMILDQDELKSQSLQILEETFDDELENELWDDPIAQCIEHAILCWEFEGLLDPVYETPYGDDRLGKLAGAKLTKVGRIVQSLLYEDRWTDITIGNGPYTINRSTKQLTPEMRERIMDAFHPGVPLKSLRF